MHFQNALYQLRRLSSELTRMTTVCGVRLILEFAGRRTTQLTCIDQTPDHNTVTLYLATGCHIFQENHHSIRNHGGRGLDGRIILIRILNK